SEDRWKPWRSKTPRAAPRRSPRVRSLRSGRLSRAGLRAWRVAIPSVLDTDGMRKSSDGGRDVERVVAVVVLLLADAPVADGEHHAAVRAQLGAGGEVAGVDREHAGPGGASHDALARDDVLDHVEAVLAHERAAVDEGSARAGGVAASAGGGHEVRALGEERVGMHEG